MANAVLERPLEPFDSSHAPPEPLQAPPDNDLLRIPRDYFQWSTDLSPDDAPQPPTDTEKPAIDFEQINRNNPQGRPNFGPAPDRRPPRSRLLRRALRWAENRLDSLPKPSIGLDPRGATHTAVYRYHLTTRAYQESHREATANKTTPSRNVHDLGATALRYANRFKESLLIRQRKVASALALTAGLVTFVGPAACRDAHVDTQTRQQIASAAEAPHHPSTTITKPTTILTPEQVHILSTPEGQEWLENGIVAVEEHTGVQRDKPEFADLFARAVQFAAQQQ